MRVRRVAGLALYVISALIGGQVLAEEYSYFEAAPNYNDGNPGPFVASNQKISFDTDSNTLSLEVTFDEIPSIAPDGTIDGLIFSITGGPVPAAADPKSCEPLCCPAWRKAEAAIFYLDARDPASPKITVYTYNGRSPHPKPGSIPSALPSGCPADYSYLIGPAGIAGSTKDLIHSSTDTGWIIKNTVSDAGGKRTFSISVDATAINAHVPLYANDPNNWKGAGVSNTINYKIWPFIIADFEQRITYAGDGSLTKFDPSGCGRQFVCDEDTDVGPECNVTGAGQTSYSNLTCGGISTSVTLDGSASYDPDGGPQDLTYAWSTDCPGGFIDNPASPNPELTFSSIGPDGKPTLCSISLTVNDGFASESCKAKVSVEACPKDCKDIPNGTAKYDRCGVCDGDGQSCINCEDKDVAASLIELDSGANKITGVARKLRAKIRKVRGKTTAAEDKLLEAAKTLNNKIWQDINQKIPVTFEVCEVTEFCINTSHAEVLEEYKAGSNELFSIVRELGKSYSKVLVKKKGLSKAAAAKAANRLVKKAAGQNEANQLEASSLPTVSSACF